MQISATIEHLKDQRAKIDAAIAALESLSGYVPTQAKKPNDDALPKHGRSGRYAEKRAKIAEMLKAGHSAPQVAIALKARTQTVYDVKKPGSREWMIDELCERGIDASIHEDTGYGMVNGRILPDKELAHELERFNMRRIE